MVKSSIEGLHAIAYCRVSTNDKGQTTATQRRLIKEWADNVGVIVDEYFNDEGKSGDMWPRPGLSMALITLNNSPSAVILVAYDESRLTRNASDDLPQIKKSLKEGALIRYAIYNDDDPDTLGLRITSAVKGCTDSAELEKLRRRTEQGMLQRKIAGKHIGRPRRLIITDDDPKTLPSGMVQLPDGTVTPGYDKSNDDLIRHYTGYKRGTRIFTTDEILSYARRGWTVYRLSKAIDISYQTLDRQLRDAKIRDRYETLLSDYQAHKGAVS